MYFSKAATAVDVLKLMDFMTWQEISLIMLTNGHGVELEVSGSIKDGLSLTYTEDSKSWIAKEETSMDQCREIMRLFASGETAWRDTLEFEFFQNADGSLPEGQRKSGCLAMVLLVLSIGWAVITIL